MTNGRQVTAVVMEIYQTRAYEMDDKRFANGCIRGPTSVNFFPHTSLRGLKSENVDQVTLFKVVIIITIYTNNNVHEMHHKSALILCQCSVRIKRRNIGDINMESNNTRTRQENMPPSKLWKFFLAYFIFIFDDIVYIILNFNF